MKKIFLGVLAVYLVIIVIPTSITFIYKNNAVKSESKAEIKSEEKQEDKLISKYDDLYLTYTEEGTQKNIKLEDYLVGVLAAEVSPSFEEEALKAQAVASRTYAYNKIFNLKDNKVLDVKDISQVFLNNSEIKKRWGNNYDSYYNIIRNAIDKTKGEILTYNDEPIVSAFHATSAGVTQNSKDAWGTDKLPYLKSVDSSLDKGMINFEETKEFTKKDLANILKTKYPNQDINEGNILSLIKISDINQNGYIINMNIGTEQVKANEIRSILGLRSTNFIIEEKKDKILITTKGYGHGVGMSQNGANLMAKEGKDYKSILNHYYSDVILKKTE